MTTVDSKGRIVLPKEIRERLGITPGTEVEVHEEKGKAVVEPEDGEFECELEMVYGENTVVVAAASERDLERASTTVRRFTL